MAVFDRSFIFVSFEQGAGGHRVARELMMDPDTYWYSHPSNGLTPDDVPTSTAVLGRSISPMHFDRITPHGILPPTWDYMKRFIPDEAEYWKLFEAEFLAVRGDEIEQTLVYCTHMLPEDLLRVFPNSRVVSIEASVEVIVDRYLLTTALFPGYVKAQWLNGPETEYGQFLARINDEMGPNFTIRDVWSFSEYDEPYDVCMDSGYYNHLYAMMAPLVRSRAQYSHEQVGVIQ